MGAFGSNGKESEREPEGVAEYTGNEMFVHFMTTQVEGNQATKRKELVIEAFLTTHRLWYA